MAFDNQPLFFSMNQTRAALCVPTRFTFCLRVSWACPHVVFPRHTGLHTGCPSMARRVRALEVWAGQAVTWACFRSLLHWHCGIRESQSHGQAWSPRKMHGLLRGTAKLHRKKGEPKGTRGILGLTEKKWSLVICTSPRYATHKMINSTLMRYNEINQSGSMQRDAWEKEKMSHSFI